MQKTIDLNLPGENLEYNVITFFCNEGGYIMCHYGRQIEFNTKIMQLCKEGKKMEINRGAAIVAHNEKEFNSAIRKFKKQS